MPFSQQTSVESEAGRSDCSADILQRINSILDTSLERVDQRGQPEGEPVLSISELLGLNSPRSVLLGNTSQTPVGGGHYGLQRHACDETTYQSMTSSLQTLQRNLDSVFPTSPVSCYPRPLRGSPPYSGGGGSPTLEQALMLANTRGRSNSPADSDNSGASGTSLEHITELMSSLTVNQSSLMPHTSIGVLGTEQELANLQALHTMAPYGRYIHTGLQGNLIPMSPPADKSWGSLPQFPLASPTSESSLELAAIFQRNAASLYDANCAWSGTLPPRNHKNPVFSCKVFLGGIPWDISEASLIASFKQFGPVRVEWPGKDQSSAAPKGYVYIIFESEKQVKSLLQFCTQDFANGANWYYKISSRRMKSKEVQVIPWMLSDSNYVKSTSQKLDPQKTVFVGALHGMLNAEGLAKIMNDLFDGVVYAGIDTDKYKYPIGSGRVTFNNHRSYLRAVAAAFIEIKTAKFTKKVQVDPYLEDSLCSNCNLQQGPYFCREVTCFRYFCRSCWQLLHTLEPYRNHKPLMRNPKSGTILGFGNPRSSN